MDPHDALTEIATLLERERSSRYKSKAFRTAADAIEGLSDAQLRDAATLRRRKGIGDSTFAVIQEALEGRVPAYLEDLRERAGVQRSSALRGLLRGDLHSHSNWSDGLTSIDLMVDAARALGHEYLALTDHSPRLRVANGLSPERLREQLEIVSAMSGDGFTLLKGVEVEINSRPERQDPPDELLALALELGCLFSIDSDAHAPGQLSLIDHGAQRAERAGIPAERIVTTWPLERLREWTGRHR